MIKRQIQHKEVARQENSDLGLDPCCHECVSHLSRTKSGYIQSNRDGFRLLHKWVYWQATGERPEVVWHLCGHRTCVNPDHMQGITADEARSMMPLPANGHPPVPYGRQCYRRVSDDKLAKIREMLSEGEPATVIARQLGFAYRTVWAIANGQAYVHG